MGRDAASDQVRPVPVRFGRLSDRLRLHPDTRAEDGDPLDAMVCVSQPTFPGCVIPVEVVALFRMRDEKGVDDKILCVPCDDPEWSHISALEDLPEQLCDEIAHFYSIYKEPEGHKVEVQGWRPREQGLEVIEESRRRWATERED